MNSPRRNRNSTLKSRAFDRNPLIWKGESMRRNQFVIRCAVMLAFVVLGWGITRLKVSLLAIPAEEGFGVSAGSGTGEAVRRMSKLRTRAKNRHLIEDENGRAFFIAGVCP